MQRIPWRGIGVWFLQVATGTLLSALFLYFTRERAADWFAAVAGIASASAAFLAWRTSERTTSAAEASAEAARQSAEAQSRALQLEHFKVRQGLIPVIEWQNQHRCPDDPAARVGVKLLGPIDCLVTSAIVSAFIWDAAPATKLQYDDRLDPPPTLAHLTEERLARNEQRISPGETESFDLTASVRKAINELREYPFDYAPGASRDRFALSCKIILEVFPGLPVHPFEIWYVALWKSTGWNFHEARSQDRALEILDPSHRSMWDVYEVPICTGLFPELPPPKSSRRPDTAQ